MRRSLALALLAAVALAATLLPPAPSAQQGERGSDQVC